MNKLPKEVLVTEEIGTNGREQMLFGEYIFERNNEGLYINYSDIMKGFDKSGELSRVIWVLFTGKRLKWKDVIYHKDGNYQDMNIDNLAYRERVWDPNWKYTD